MLQDTSQCSYAEQQRVETPHYSYQEYQGVNPHEKSKPANFIQRAPSLFYECMLYASKNLCYDMFKILIILNVRMSICWRMISYSSCLGHGSGPGTPIPLGPSSHPGTVPMGPSSHPGTSSIITSVNRPCLWRRVGLSYTFIRIIYRYSHGLMACTVYNT